MSVARAAAPSATVDEARRALLARIRPLPAEEVPLAEALGRVLAAAVVAATDLPGGDNSAMDGFAVVAADIAAASEARPVSLPVGEPEARAGSPRVPHRAGTATLIATGALLPDGADSVVPVELIEREGSSVVFSRPARPGQHVRRMGEDVRAGDVVLPAGTRLRSVDIGACAAAGCGTVSVSRRPRVALLSTGDELIAPGARPLPHQVTDVNGVMLAAAVREAGGLPLPTGPVPDVRERVAGALRDASAGADLVISSAGVSMGGHDHLRDCVAELGEIDLWGVAMRPGRPLVVGAVGGTPYLGLPGNPVSSAVTFLLFGRAAILAMQGAAALLPATVAASLGEPFDKPAGLETYVRVVLEAGPEGTVARSSGGQGSAMMHGLAAADALAVLPAGRDRFDAGSIVEAILLP